MSVTSLLERRVWSRLFGPKFLFQPLPVEADLAGQPLYIGQMICFCAERFHWRRIWQNPGELLLPGLSDMATRALLYRRPAEPSTLLVKHGSQIYSIRLRRHRRARRYTLRIHPTDREAILTMPPRGTLADAKDFAQRARRLDRRAPRPVAEGRAVSTGHRGAVARRPAPDRASRRRARHGVDRNPRQRRADHLRGRRRRAYRAAGATIISSARRARICRRRRRPMRRNSASGSSGCRSAINRAAGVPAPRRDRCRSRGG